jgi:hypothetical protein
VTSSRLVLGKRVRWCNEFEALGLGVPPPFVGGGPGNILSSYLQIAHSIREGWRDDYLLPGTEKLELHHRYSGDGLFGRTAAYIVGVRMRRQKEVTTEVLGHRGRWFESVPERQNPKDPAPLKLKEVRVEGRRYVVCLNEEERRKDAHDRQAIVAHLRQQLRQGDKSLVGNKGYRRYLKPILNTTNL